MTSSHQPDLPIVMYGTPWYRGFDQVAAADRAGNTWFFEMFNEEKSEMINAGDLILVEVHGLPDNNVNEFTYRSDRPLTVGEQVQVPAPDWSIRVTGRDELPGFVLGTVGQQDVHPDYNLRNILPQAQPVVQSLADLLARWRADEKAANECAFTHYEIAQHHEKDAEDIHSRIRQLEDALGNEG